MDLCFAGLVRSQQACFVGSRTVEVGEGVFRGQDAIKRHKVQLDQRGVPIFVCGGNRLFGFRYSCRLRLGVRGSEGEYREQSAAKRCESVDNS